jgi:hypothetical protein
MKKLMTVLAVLTIALSLGAVLTSAQSSMTLNIPTVGDATFSAGGTNKVDMCASGCSLVNSFGDSFVIHGLTFIPGNYTLSFSSTVLGLIGGVGPNFNISSGGGGSIVFTDTVGGGGTVDLSLLLTLVKDGTSTPNLVGTWSLVSASGNLAGLFGGTGSFDVTLGLTNSCTLDSMAAGTCSPNTGALRSGLVSPTPEPASMLLFGGGLLMVGAVLRRRRPLVRA